MPQNLFAACRESGSLFTKRIPLKAEVQNDLKAVFREQEEAFRKGVTEEIPFDGRWKPEEDEFLTIGVDEVPEAVVFEKTIEENALSFSEIDTGKFAVEGIKALFTYLSSGDETKVLVQRFTSLQVLDKKIAFLFHGNAFGRLTEPAFTLPTNLTCIIEDGLIKFKSLRNLRSILNLRDVYREATDSEVADFAKHPNLDIEDKNAFIEMTNQMSRKQIKIVLEEKTLDLCEPANITAKAEKTGLTVDMRDGKIVMPTEPTGIRELLRFLTEGRYSGPLSGQTYVTNSQRRV